VADDTAVLEAPGTAVEQVAPPQEAAPETVTDALTPETDAPETPETAPPTPPPDPLEALSDDDLQNHPKLQKLLEGHEARWRESARRQFEAQQARAAREREQAESYQYLTQGAYADFDSIIRAVEEGQEYDPNSVATVAQRVAQSAVAQTARYQRDSAVTALQQLAPGVQLPPQVVAFLDDAMFSGDPARAITALVQVAGRAATLAASPKLRAQVEAELRQKADAAAKTQQLREAVANRDEGPTTGLPTAGSLSPGNFKSVREADAAIADGKWSPTREEFTARTAGLPY
jgi:hypothetical protein